MSPETPPTLQSNWRRLHPATLLFTLGGDIKRLLLPGLLVLFFARGHRGELWLMAMLLPALLYRLCHYFSFRYRFTTQEMIVVEGIVFRQERHIPLDRVQNIDVVQSPLQRILRVASLSVQTASGKEPEAKLEVVSLAALEQMRELVFGAREPSLEAGLLSAPPADQVGSPVPALADAPQGEVLVRLTTTELFKLALIAQRGIVLVAAAFGAAWEFDLFERLDLEWLAGHVRDLGVPIGWIALLLVVLAVAVFLVLSIVWTVLRFSGYELRQVGDELRRECGLLTRVSATVPRRRIQLISVRESLVHRLFRCATVRIETAGGEEDVESPSRQWFIPLLPRSDADRVLAHLRPDFPWSELSWQPPSPRATRRLVRRAVGVSLVVGVLGLSLLWPWGGFVFPVVLCLAIWHAVATPRRMRYALTDQGVAFRSGLFTRKTTATFYDKIQSVALAESPFDRRHAMSALAVDTAGAGPAGHQVRIPLLDRDVCETIFSAVASKVEQAEFEW